MSVVKTPYGDATEVPLRVFLHQVLPSMPCNEHFDTLFADREVTGRMIDGPWSGIPPEMPALEGPGGGPVVFESLPACARKLARALPHSMVAQLDMEDNEDSEWDLEKRDIEDLPDAYFLDRRRPLDEPVGWMEIVVPGVYSKENTTKAVEDNITKVTRCMSRCMNRDPRRRFVYAFAMEGTMMHLWYCNRARIIVSEPFDFAAERNIGLFVIMSFMYAERHHIGFDPTMRLVGRD